MGNKIKQQSCKLLATIDWRACFPAKRPGCSLLMAFRQGG